MQKPVMFDIETGPLPLAEIEHLVPKFEAPANYKDPEKIKASIEDQKARWLEGAALSATTGRVLCIGLLFPDAPVATTIYGDKSESEALILEDWWNICREQIQAGNSMVGFCIKNFDLPFLIRRSWKLRIAVPRCIWSGPRYFSDSIVDIAERWALGGREQRDRISLNDLSKFLGVGQKSGEGKDFAALWATNRIKALEYLQNDLQLTKACYEQMEGQ